MSIETKTLQQKANSPLAQITSSHRIMTVDTSGNIDTATAATVGNAITSGMDINALMDGVFIAYHAKRNNNPAIVKLHKWASLQSSGEIADGVMIMMGEKHLIVAPTEASLNWSSAQIQGGGYRTNDFNLALSDWAGRANTTAQITHTQASGENYAPGYCNAYSRTNANGQGLTAGCWWLPSFGELAMIYANMAKINFALSLINGATQLAEDYYWSSTERETSISAWCLKFDSGSLDYSTKNAYHFKTRPVSTF